MEYKEIAERLTKWYERYGRKHLPWRKKSDPKTILIAEFLLQRTKAENIEKVFEKFLSEYGDFEKLASATSEELRLFFGRLGLFYRGERLVQVAKIIVNEYGDEVPCDMESLLRLPGVGVYIASAVLNFGCGIPTPVVDKNVLRVLNRLKGITSETEARKFIENLYRYGNYKIIAYALIDLGALICRDNPRCVDCPLNDLCLKYPLKKTKWKMLRKIIGKRGRVKLQEQPVYSGRKRTQKP